VRKLTAALLPLALALAVASCSSDDDPDQAGTTQPTLPAATGDACDDPASDITADVKADGVGAEPAGIDITRAEAELTDDDQLDITFTTTGPITETSGTTFAVAQGTPFSPLAFELRATAGDAGTWDLKAITWDSAERSTSVPVRPTVSGNTLSFTVPMENLPPLGLYLSFGASSVLDGVGRVLDDCSSLTTAPTIG
jgi:hypothetical protein